MVSFHYFIFLHIFRGIKTFKIIDNKILERVYYESSLKINIIIKFTH